MRSLWSKRGETSLDEFDQALIDVIGNDHPETLEQAIKLVRLRCAEIDEALMERVLRLESEGKITRKRGTHGLVDRRI